MPIYRLAVLPVAFHRNETWPLTLREVNNQRVFKNRGAEEDIWV
jgi:hypothetical protein